MFGCASAIDLDALAEHEVPRALNFLPMAHMFGCGTVVAITYLGEIKKSIIKFIFFL
jgi:long-subunit acyl-CoA synthetase (AMP-forming)